MALIQCKNCGKNISSTAKKCPHCNFIYNIENNNNLTAKENTKVIQVIHENVNIPKWNVGTAIVLSFFVPGTGQMYKGQIFNGLFWLFTVTIGYFFFFVPGLILHLFCLIGASIGDPMKYEQKISFIEIAFYVALILSALLIGGLAGSLAPKVH